MINFFPKLERLKPAVRLDERRKREIRQVLEQRASLSFSRAESAAPRQGWFSWVSFWITHPLPLASALVLILAIIGAGATYAAADSLPGDRLYPVKVRAEGVRIALAFSSNAKADLAMTRAESRLEEADQLVLQSRVTVANKRLVEENFDRHAAEIQNHIDELERTGNGQAALDLNSRFESVLRAHQQVLNSLQVQAQPPAAELKPLQTNVANKLDSVKRKRAKLEEGDGHNAEASITAAEQAVAELKATLTEQNPEAMEKLEAHLERAKKKNQSGDYKDSVYYSNRAIREAREMKTLVRLKHKFNVDVRFGMEDEEERGEEDPAAQEQGEVQGSGSESRISH